MEKIKTHEVINKVPHFSCIQRDEPENQKMQIIQRRTWVEINEI